MPRQNKVLLNCMKIFIGGYLIHIFISILPTVINRLNGWSITWTSANSTGWSSATNSTLSNGVYAATGSLGFLPVLLLILAIVIVLITLLVLAGKNTESNQKS